jgi:hypothetical protein
MSSPVSMTPLGESIAIRNQWCGETGLDFVLPADIHQYQSPQIYQMPGKALQARATIPSP